MHQFKVIVNGYGGEMSFSRFSTMRANEMLTDNYITSRDGQRFPVHSLVMAASSDYFYEKLSKPQDDSLSKYGIVDDPFHVNIDSKIVEQIISFCYSGCIELAADTLDEILTGAKELGISALMTPCCGLLEEILNDSNCLQMLQMAEEYDLNSLQEKALTLINERLPVICKSFEFYHMDVASMRRLFQHLSRLRQGAFDDLLKSLDPAESEFITWIPELFVDGSKQALVRSAFIAGYIRGIYHSKNVNLPSYEANVPELEPICQFVISENTFENTENKMKDKKTNNNNNNNNEDECSDGIDSNKSEAGTSDSGSGKTTAVPALHMNIDGNDDTDTSSTSLLDTAECILVHMHPDLMHFSKFCEIEFKWEQIPTGFVASFNTEQFNETIMISAKKCITIFTIGNSVISRVQLMNLMSFTMAEVELPARFEYLGTARFCLLNDEIYCFGRKEKMFYHKFNTTTKLWSMGHIADSMDSLCMVGFHNELYFIGCGFTRSAVHSYHINENKWASRGHLNFAGDVDIVKAIASNGSIYVVHSSYDSTKVFDRTEFCVQRYNESNGWVLIRTIRYAHYVNHFHLDTAGPFIFLFYGEGEVQRYDCRHNEWNKLPAVDFSLVSTPICIMKCSIDDLRTKILSSVGEAHY